MSVNDAPLPLGSDLEAVEAAVGRPKPVHLSWPNIGLVAVGAAVGTGLRYLITLLVPHWAGVPVATLGINVVGAFLLGALLELLADHSIGWLEPPDPARGWHRRPRRVHHVQRACR